MKQFCLNFFFVGITTLMMAPVALLAQKEEKKDDKDKEKKETQQIIITRKAGDNEKVVIEVNGDKVTVNGKPIEGKDDDVKVTVNKWKDYSYLMAPGRMKKRTSGDYEFFTGDSNKAMLGVTTGRTDGGVEVQSVTKESAAEKAGLKENDIITKIDDKKIEDPDDLSSIIQDHKPGDKVTITYLRDKKENKVTAELTKWKGVPSWTISGDHNFNFDMGDLKRYLPNNTMVAPRIAWTGNGPKLGLSIQDSEDGKGVKVTEVDEESNAAKAGIKEDDIITEADGKPINNTDDMVKVIRETREKNSIMVKLQRAGKTQNVEVKMPRRIKTADL